MFYFVCYEDHGFVQNLDCELTHNVREAHSFSSFKDADDFGREHAQGVAYAVLSNCIGMDLKFYTVRIKCTSGIECAATLVAHDSEHAMELVKTKLHEHVQNFTKKSLDKDQMFLRAESSVKESSEPQILKLDWTCE